MRDDNRAHVLKYLVTGDVIGVVVRVHQIAHRLWRDLADFAQQGPGRVAPEETVDHQHRIVADNETSVRFWTDRGIDPRADFLQLEWQRGGRWRLGGGGMRQQVHRCQSRTQSFA